MWVHETPIIELIFVTLTENSSVVSTNSALVFLPADREASWPLLQSFLLLLSDSIVQPQNTFSCILKVTVQVW